MDRKVSEITAEQTLKIRHHVMWPDKPLEYVQLPNDDQGRHFGLFVEERLVSVISLFVEGTDAQFRKFATLVDCQGKGYGSFLLDQIFTLARQSGIHRIWCNARVEKTHFYSKFGMKETDHHFEKGGIAYVVMEMLMAE